MGIVILCYLAVVNAGGMIVVALLFGFFSGVFIALPPVLFVAFTEDKTKIGTRIGMGFAMLGIGVLAGAPGSGGILGNNQKDLDWNGCWTYAGVAAIVSTCIFIALRFIRVGAKLKVKV